MTDRTARAIAFLARTDWAGAQTEALAGDASNRRYLRIRRGRETAVLMDAPIEGGEDVRPFIAIAQHLIGLDLSAPRILARNVDEGFLLIEDLGDDLFARIIPKNPALEETLYQAATDVLISLHRHDVPPGLAAYDTPLMAQMTDLAFDWYADDPAPGPNIHAALADLLDRHTATPGVLVQRDYHAENLLWLPDRHGPARVGLLDFQDAMRGHPAYDLVSLLQDARRDVRPALAERMMQRYISGSGADRDAFDAAYHVLGAQRNLRILGVFARLCLRDGKAQYVDLIPRVWAHLMHDLDHPVLADAGPLIRRALPEPKPAVLEGMKRRCRPHQTQ